VTKDDIRALFIDFFVQRGHALLPNTSLIPDDDTVLFTIAGVQQVQPFFMGLAEPPSKRLVSVQRCLRTPDIESVGDDSHLTFFEMLGNWSIGDYFKRQAVEWSWELCRRAGFPAARIWVTVYRSDDGTEQDQETYDLWREVGVPAERIVYLGEADNWWAPGPVGPCGPDSEIFYDRGVEYGCGRADCRPGCDCDRFLEFWNNVFTQYYRAPDGSLSLLEHKNVDTGAGLERWTMLLQGKSSVFETDCFWPLIQAVEAATGARFGGDAAADRSLRIIADHGRALTFTIADGVYPGAKGRGYVLRRLLRRAVLHGWLLGLRRPFLAEVVVPAVVDMMGAAYPDLVARRSYIAEIAATEERQFLKTIEVGLLPAEELLDRTAGAARDGSGVVNGAEVFQLFQTRGFPYEVMRELAAGRGLTIDRASYDQAYEEHRRRPQGGMEGDKERATRKNKAYGEIAEAFGRTPEFLGYDTLVAEGRVVGIVDDASAAAVVEAQPGDAVDVVLDRTPFYAASGGQMGDHGALSIGDTVVRVTMTERPKGSAIVVQRGTVEGGPLRVGDEVEARVDPAARMDAARHHSATHLAHRALKDTLGEGVHQEGSVVEPGHLTFDFNLARPMTAEEIARVEEHVNRLIRADLPVETVVMPYAEAVKTGAMALFSEKYGDRVRVVTMGPSRELCGGTHVRRTGEIGLFLILSESSVSAGIRRIECVAGDPAYRYTRGRLDELRGLARELEAQPGQVMARVAQLRESTRALERQLNGTQQELANLRTQVALGSVSADGASGGGAVEHADGFRYVVLKVQAASLDDLEGQSDAFKGRLAPSCVVVLGAAIDGRAVFTAAVTRDVADRGIARAGDLVKAATAAAGGKGGGNPTWAKGSAPDAGKVDAGLTAARELLTTVG